MSGKKEYIVSVDADSTKAVDEINERLHEAGFELKQRLESVGVLTGMLDPAQEERVRAIPGVKDLAPGGKFYAQAV